MQKVHAAFYRSLFLSAFTVVGCGDFKDNTNMQIDFSLRNEMLKTKDRPVFDMFGLPDRSNTETYTTENLKYNLAQPPANTVPTEKNKAIYNTIKTNALNYVKDNIAKANATHIVSVKKFADVLKEANFDESYYNETKITEQNFIAIPFTEKSSKDSKPVDLSAYKTRTGINSNSRFKVYGTKNGKKDESVAVEGTVYLFTYKLNNSDTKYSALITVPDNLTEANQLPLILYAHGGDSGVSFRNMAQLMQSTLSQGIVVAPSFPGEDICAITTLGGVPQNLLRRSCGDANGNIATPVVQGEGARSPLDDDVNALIGAHNAITKFVLTTDPTKSQINFDTKNIDQGFSTKVKFLTFNSKTSPISFLNSPKTLGVADSRGGATLLATLGRIGLYYENIFTQLLTDPKLNPAAMQQIPKLPLLSGAALYYSPSSFLMGPFAIPLQHMLKGELLEQSSYNMFPMIPDLNKNKFFTEYRNAPNNNHEQELNKITGWLAASDITFLGPYISVAMQNWTYTLDSISTNLFTNLQTQMAEPKNSGLIQALTQSGALTNGGSPNLGAIIQQLPALKNKDTNLSTQLENIIQNTFKNSIASRNSAPGSIILLHATQDQVVPYTQSLIAKTVFDKVFDSVHKEVKDNKEQNPLTRFRIPPVGAQLFAFQPENKFYALNIDKRLPNGMETCKEVSKKDGKTFNLQTQKCIAALAHGDAAFATSTLINNSVNQAAADTQQLQNILKQGINKADNTANTLTSINGAYQGIAQQLNGTIQQLNGTIQAKDLEIKNKNTSFDALQLQKNTVPIATRKDAQAQFIKAKKDLVELQQTHTTLKQQHDYLAATQLQTECKSRSNPTGACYIKNGVQFHRPLQIEFSQKESLLEGYWDEKATESVWTPSDVLQAWFASAAQEVLNK